jgi:hypothetical protein
MSPQPVRGDKGQAEVTGIGRYPARPLHQFWIDTVREAADTYGPEDGEGWYDVKTAVYIKHSSPGWVDGFKVQVSAGG